MYIVSSRLCRKTCLKKEKKSKKLVIHATQYIMSVLFLLRCLTLEHIKHSHSILSADILCCTLCLTGGSLTEKFLSNTNKVVFYLSTALWTVTYPRSKLWKLEGSHLYSTLKLKVNVIQTVMMYQQTEAGHSRPL